LIVSPDVAEKIPNKTLIEVANPKLAFALIGAALHPPLRREAEIHETAVVAQSADVALTAYIGPHVQIGENARVGAYTRIEAQHQSTRTRASDLQPQSAFYSEFFLLRPAKQSNTLPYSRWQHSKTFRYQRTLSLPDPPDPDFQFE
jgi:hypothetical protein